MPSVVEPPTLGVLYSSTAMTTGSLLDGRVRTVDGGLDIVLAKPIELGGTGTERGNNPTQLLAAAYSASFLAALLAVRSHDEAQYPVDTAVRATVGFGLREDGGFGLEITLEVNLPGFEPERAETLMEKARRICSVCDATRKEVMRFKLV